VDSFFNQVRATVTQARERARRAEGLPPDDLRRQYEIFEARIERLFRIATAASDGFFEYSKLSDGHYSAHLHRLAVRRTQWSNVALFFRVDTSDLKAWTQVHEASNREHARGGWFNVPLLLIPDYDAYIKGKILDLTHWIDVSEPSASKF